MPTFPDIIGSKRGDMVPAFSAASLYVGRGRTAIYRKALLPRFVIPLEFSKLTPAEARQIDDFVLSVAGRGISFYWKDWFALPWKDVPIVPAGGGAETGYNVGGAESTGHAFFTSSGSISGTVAPGDGDDGGDFVDFASPPTSAVWMNATMKRIFECWFEDDNQPLTTSMDDGYYSFSMRLVTKK